MSRHGKLTILFLAANPKDTTQLQLDQEIRAIDIELRKAKYRNSFDLRSHWAVQYSDLQELLLRYSPSIVHFSGHSSQAGEIVLHDNDGNPKRLSTEALASLFAILKDQIRCVVLNACYSEKQAQAIAEHIECVIGMSRAISDSAAIDFSSAFYSGLGFGSNVETAFKLGCNRIELAGFDESDGPRILARHVSPRDIVLVNERRCIDEKNTKDIEQSAPYLNYIEPADYKIRQHQLIANYLDEILLVFKYWQLRYVTLAAQTTSDSNDPLRQLPTSGDEIPYYFQPKGFVVTRNKDEQREPKTEFFKDVRDAVVKTSDAVLIGAPGSGKTTTLWRMMYDYAHLTLDNQSSQIPILVNIANYKGEIDVLEYVKNQLATTSFESNTNHFQSAPAHRIFAEIIDILLEQKRLVLFIDGLNEIPRLHYKHVITKLDIFRVKYLGNLFLFTCRTSEYHFDDLALPTIEIQPLNREGMENFIRVYMPADEANKLIDQRKQNNQWMWQLGQNPYFLRMIVSVYRSHQIIPNNYGEIFSNFVETLLGREYVTHPYLWNISQNNKHQTIQLKLVETIKNCLPFFNNWRTSPSFYGARHLTETDWHQLITTSGYVILSLTNLAYAMSSSDQYGTVANDQFVFQNLPQKLDVNDCSIDLNTERILSLAHHASLIERKQGQVRFIHQLIQDYFTALAMFLEFNICNKTFITSFDSHSQICNSLTQEPEWKSNKISLDIQHTYPKTYSLLKLLESHKNPSRSEFDIFSQMITVSSIPVSLRERVAELTQRCWKCLGEMKPTGRSAIETEPEPWMEPIDTVYVTEHWKILSKLPTIEYSEKKGGNFQGKKSETEYYEYSCSLCSWLATKKVYKYYSYYHDPPW